MTIVLSIGVTNMSKRNAVIRKLTAVETLGCAQVICSDKTGTLTQNKMTVVDHWGDEAATARAMSLCSDANPDETGSAVGEPTECALVNWATKLGLAKPALEAETPRVGEAPFDSGRKMMSTIHKTADGFLQYTKGAPDEVLKKCTHYLKDGKVLPLDEAGAKGDPRPEQGHGRPGPPGAGRRPAPLRRHARRPVPGGAGAGAHLPGPGGHDRPHPPRGEGRHRRVQECRHPGGDDHRRPPGHRRAIARQLGILEHDDQAITGAQLNQMSDEELDRNIRHYSVYARVQPEHKVRIVNA